MGKEDVQRTRRKRLEEAATKAGGKAALGRLLGFKDGAFVGQMIRGERPVTEDTVANLEAKPGYRGWFSTTESAAGATLLIAEDERTAAALVELVQFFRELPAYDQAALLQEAHDRAARAMGDRLLAEKFGVKGYASDGRLPPIFRDLERRRATRTGDPSGLVESPLSSTRGHRLPRPANDESEEGAK
jgi:hypothetical protein